jgi:hypothetical protein
LASSGEHAVHDAPPAPHAFTLGEVVQPAGEQQPLGQLVASHSQMPVRQWKPLGHAGPWPHRQPPALQLSAPTPQATHAVPLAPHSPAPGFVQLAIAQHPPAHDVASHTQLPLRQR